MTQIRVAAIQTNPVFGEISANVESALAQLPAQTDLAVFPELFNTGYQFHSRDEAWKMAEDLETGPTCKHLRQAAASSNTVLIAGLAERAGDHVYNTAVLIRPDGSLEKYRKIHLFWDEKDIFTPGDLEFCVVTAAGARVGMMVCFDWVFPEAARTLALRGAEILCHPSNLVLQFCPDAMITRCLENRVFAITANRVGSENRTGQQLDFIGLSQVVGPGGDRFAQ